MKNLVAGNQILKLLSDDIIIPYIVKERFVAKKHRGLLFSHEPCCRLILEDLNIVAI